MTSRVVFSGRDYGKGEITRLAVLLGDVTSVNYDARIASKDALLAAINGVTVDDNAFTGQQFNAVDISVGAAHGNKDAQRERKWRVPLIDSVNPLGNWSFEIGMADSANLAAGTEVMDVAAGAGLALVQALVANCVSRLGNAVTVGPIVLVGRTG